MQPQIPQRSRVNAAVVFLPLLALMLACGGDDKAKPEANTEAASSGSQSSIQTQPLESDPCAWVTTAEVEHLVGKLDGAPRTISQDGGTACVYTLPESDKPAYTLPGTTPNREIVTIRIDFRDPMVYEAAYGMGAQLIAQDPGYQAMIAAEGPIEKPGTPAGWDYFGEGPSGSVFRLGHMAVVIGVYTPRHFDGKKQTAIAVKLANLIRDRVPDLPVAAEHPEWDGGRGGPDPCTLVTTQEAEGVLGKLALPPYRSKGTTPFVDGDGDACSYYLGKHRVLVLTPHWSGGRELFQLASGLSQEITSKTGVGEESADTLEGPWDQAGADTDGTLNLLAGDKMLELSYRMAGIDAGGALKLARLAVERLQSQ